MRRWISLTVALASSAAALLLGGAVLAQSTPPKPDAGQPAGTAVPVPAVRARPGWTPSARPDVGIEAIDASGMVTITTEGFEGAFPSAGWNVDTGAWGASACRPYTGSRSAWIKGKDPEPACFSPYGNNEEYWMVYGPFDLSTALSASLSFSLYLNSEPGFDVLFWGSAVTSTFSGYGLSGSSSGWLNRWFDLGDRLGQSSVSIAFVWASDSSITRTEGAYVDNVVLIKQVPAPNLVVQKSADKWAAQAGELLTYTISMHNNGTLDAAGARLTDTLPLSMSLVGGSLQASSGTAGASGQTITWTGSVNISQVVRITYTTALTNSIPDGVMLTNPVTATDGAGGVYAAQATVAIGQRQVYLPTVLRGWCPAATITDPHYLNGNLDNMTQINADDAWMQCVQGDPSIIVAVIDSGVDLDHPDLVANLIPGFDYVDDDATPQDGNGHGTNVAGIVGAPLNGIGVVGVAPRTRILPVRVLNNSGSGSLSDVASGITYAADRAHVLNLSLAGVTSPQTLADAINYAAVTRGRLVVAAAGNCGDSNFFLNGCSFKNQPSYPAAYDNAFAVAAVTPGNTRASFSTVGAYVDIAAPGVDIFSTWPNDISPFVDYLAESGTSQAAPHVAGLAALIWARNPGYTAAQVRSTIQVNATDLLTAGLDSETGYGLINVIPSVGLSSLAAAPASAAEPRLESLPKPVDLRDAPIVPGRVLVKFAPAASAAHIERQLSALDGVSVAGAIQDLGTLLLAVPIGQEWATVDRLRALADVEYAEPDFILHLLP